MISRSGVAGEHESHKVSRLGDGLGRRRVAAAGAASEALVDQVLDDHNGERWHFAAT